MLINVLVTFFFWNKNFRRYEVMINLTLNSSLLDKRFTDKRFATFINIFF